MSIPVFYEMIICKGKLLPQFTGKTDTYLKNARMMAFGLQTMRKDKKKIFGFILRVSLCAMLSLPNVLPCRRGV
jgi:hypothetical protein